MGPLIGSRLVEFKQKGLDVFIAVDCSLSMQTEDLKPNRMAHAKSILSQLIDRLAGSRIGLIAFAGQAYVECPLTIDANAAKDVLDTIDVGTVPIPGTVIGDAIRTAIQGLKAGEGQNRVLVLLTDGEDHHERSRRRRQGGRPRRPENFSRSASALPRENRFRYLMIKGIAPATNAIKKATSS